MKRLFACCAAVGLVGCATPSASAKKDSSEPTVERQKISNLTHFDIGTCSAPNPTLPEPLNLEGVVGALVLARPAVLECFVDPKNRGAADDSGAAVKANITDTGATFEVAGTNLTPAGIGCIETALRRLPFKPLEKGTAPVTGSAEFRHNANSPSVKLGVNAASDVAAAIRLASPAWCDCWSPIGTDAPPANLKATVKVATGKTPEVTFEPNPDASATTLAACLTPKIAALVLTPGATELTVHYPFLLVSSAASQEAAAAVPELQFIQLDLIRAQRAAEVAGKIGVRTNALKTYDALVTKYKAKPDSKLVKDLKDKCAAMVASDEDWIASLKKQGDIDARSLALASSLKAKDARWNEAEAAAQAQVTASASDVKKAEDVRTADAAVCPKERK